MYGPTKNEKEKAKVNSQKAQKYSDKTVNFEQEDY